MNDKNKKYIKIEMLIDVCVAIEIKLLRFFFLNYANKYIKLNNNKKNFYNNFECSRQNYDYSNKRFIEL